MDKYDVCAAVILDAARNAEVDLEEHCDIYSSVGKEAATLLGRYASINRLGLDSRATSKLGTPVSSTLGAFVQAVRITARIIEDGRHLAAGKTKQQLVVALKHADSSC